jgi:predicted DNA-binding WGR domain protein
MKVDYRYIGWCSEDNSDKVWICIQLSGGRIDPLDYNWGGQGKYLTAWGRRGKKLQHKVVEANGYDMDKLIRSKNSKGYRKIPEDKLNEVYPEFEQDLEKTAFWATLMA